MRVQSELVPLEVSVPSHCELMRNAADELEERLKSIEFKKPKIDVVQNVDGEIQTAVPVIKSNLVKQLYMPVRWTDCVERVYRLGCNHILECGPGRVLTGLVKRSHPSIKCFCRTQQKLSKTQIIFCLNSKFGRKSRGIMTKSEQNKLALVTGASRGIGKAIAIDLASSGLKVIGTATTSEGASRISSYLGEMEIPGMGMRVDVADDSSVESLFSDIHESFGSPMILVNNAGITRDNLLMRMKVDEWQSVVDTNLNSMFRVTKLCLKGMTKALGQNYQYFISGWCKWKRRTNKLCRV